MSNDNVKPLSEQLDEILAKQIPHYYCEDSWYSCPEAEGGSANDSKVGCDCGKNEKIQEAKQAILEAIKVDGNTSDGYHTFNELYDHRVLLWINLCLLQHSSMTYLVENHYDGWFLLGCETPQGQISYHCPNKYLPLCVSIKRRHPEFDGHSSKDVIERLELIARSALLDRLGVV